MIVAVETGYFMSPWYDFDVAPHISAWTTAPLLSLTFILSALACGLYEKPTGEGFLDLALRSATATVFAWCAAVLCQYAFFFVATGRWVVAVSGVALAGFAASGRLVLRLIQKRMPINVVVLGDERLVRSILVSGAQRPLPPLRIMSVIQPACNESLKSLAGTLTNSDNGEQRQINWITVQDRCNEATLEQLLPFFRNGTRICDAATFFEIFFQKVPVEVVGVNWLVHANICQMRMTTRVFKRAADVLAASVGLVLTSPLWPVLALAIRLSSKGPVFYRQERVGRHGGIFPILKFRTMAVDAESSGKAVWAIKEDPRTTLLGRFLRRTRLDELPQLINVLLGDMSLVGPRPERPAFVEKLVKEVPHYKLRFLIRPGITGWAQINYGYAASVEDSVEKLRYDLYYVKYGGLLLDLQIMIRTIGSLMKGSR